MNDHTYQQVHRIVLDIGEQLENAGLITYIVRPTNIRSNHLLLPSSATRNAVVILYEDALLAVLNMNH